MNLSYWEYKSYLSHLDFTIVGSGIVGLNCALTLKQKYPKAKILVLERGVLPQGASTKNAGFACFGSLSEILDDLNLHSKEEVVQLVKQRIAGLKLLRTTLGDTSIDFQNNGGFELFTKTDTHLYQKCLEQRHNINALLRPIFNTDVFRTSSNQFNFKNIQEQYIYNAFEGQIDTGKMMQALTQLVQQKGIRILNHVTVQGFSSHQNAVTVSTDQFDFTTPKLFVATNGFAKQLLHEDVQPARAQVLITKPIENLHIKGTFHLDRGYYYFRNIDNRILFGGGRNLDFKAEETTALKQTALIQNELERLLHETILPNIPFEIDRRWSGIMGVGTQKKVIVKPISDNVFCGVRLGGMGVAIGSLIGKKLANLI
ncbi:MAG: FAD-binding oxidoreductase [Flavobacteriaceae bacterium]|nr:FAD-binding oxidoreductase [Flavobacteriaceae bacterium]